jgi:predicted HicB family RNase H-like nuclease
MALENTDRSKAIKKIIEGKTYNTATSILVHHKEADQTFIVGLGNKYFQGEVELYQTRTGVFFLLYRDVLCQSPEINEGEEWFENKVCPLKEDQVKKWMENHCNNKLEQFFGSFPEAGSDEVRVTLRLPKMLRERLNKMAKSDRYHMSLNAYVSQKLLTSVLEDEAQYDD